MVCAAASCDPVPTQSQPAPVARSSGVALVVNGTRSPLAGSMREIVRSSELSTQTAPSPTATADGVAPAANGSSTFAGARVDGRQGILRAERERLAVAAREQDAGEDRGDERECSHRNCGAGPACARHETAQPGRRRWLPANRRERTLQPLGLELEDVLRPVEILQLLLAEIAQDDHAGGQLVGDQLARGVGESTCPPCAADDTRCARWTATPT